ncbi:Dyp-type peroxidase [Eubacterium aggregans]|uniref:Dyp-type peroxidase n=1 Tax=Eubacterium aggregans TaxID=81409 RepID=UPI003F3D8FC2
MKYQNVIPGQSENSIIATIALKDKKISKAALNAFQNLFDRIPSMVESLHIRYPEQEFEFAMGIGAVAWDKLFPNTKKPKELRVFPGIEGASSIAPSTPGDFFFHIRANRMTPCYDMLSNIQALIEAYVNPVDETHGFRYRDGRAIIGFVDGTENPKDSKAWQAVFIDDDSDFNGGSYVFAQKYTFDKMAWDLLSDVVQEKIIGRRKWTDLELSDKIKPMDAHTEISKAHNNKGQEMKIIRANLVYSQSTQNIYGSYFIGYSKNFSITTQMLEHMFQGTADASEDSLLNYLHAITGNIFFVPSYVQLDQMASGEIS